MPETVNQEATNETDQQQTTFTQDDVNRINVKLAEIATRLDMLTLTKG